MRRTWQRKDSKVADILTVTMNPAIDLSCAAPRVVPVRKLRCTGVRRDPGGGGINVARVVTRLGGRCTALYTAGGSPGALLTELLERESITTIPVGIARDTREDFTVFDEATSEQYRFVLPGPELEAREWRACLDRLAALPRRGGYLVASGSLPPGVPDTFFAELAEIAGRQGARLVADSSGPALARALETGAYLVKPNLRELSDLVGRALESEADWEDAAGVLVHSGKAEVVVLTLAERGALLVSADVALRAPGMALPVVSAVGAGDSFLGALVWSLSRGDDLARAFRYGMAAGTAALLRPGTELCRKEDVERLYRDIRLQEVAGRGGRSPVALARPPAPRLP